MTDDGNGEPHLGMVAVYYIATWDICTGVFVIPNQSIIGDKSLQQYQVTLQELDGYLGMKLTPHLDQKMVGYLIYCRFLLSKITACRSIH